MNERTRVVRTTSSPGALSCASTGDFGNNSNNSSSNQTQQPKLFAAGPYRFGAWDSKRECPTACYYPLPPLSSPSPASSKKRTHQYHTVVFLHPLVLWNYGEGEIFGNWDPLDCRGPLIVGYPIFV